MGAAEPSAHAMLRPTCALDVEEIIRRAVSDETSLDVRGGGSKRGLGRPVNASHTLDLSALSGIVAYEPEELVLTAQAATPVRDIAQLLAARNQMLAFEPPDYGPVLGGARATATLGGVIATNASGPRRLKSGAARDHVLGVHAVSGRGEHFVAGGRVVKNVTGYDLPKLLAGSYGTLAVMTELTLKVLPAPETEATLIFHALDDEQALRALIDAMQSACDVSGAAHLQSGLFLGADRIEASITALRIEGFAPSVDDRTIALTARLAEFGRADRLGAQASRALWSTIRDVLPFAPDQEQILWRISAPPASATKLVARIQTRLTSSNALYDWGGALIWLAMHGPHPQERLVRDAAAAHGGQAILFRAPHNVRGAMDVFPPLDEPLRALTARVKEQFDPRRVLSPGRMYAWA